MNLDLLPSSHSIASSNNKKYEGNASVLSLSSLCVVVKLPLDKRAKHPTSLPRQYVRGYAAA